MKAICVYVIKVKAIGQEGIKRWICHLQLIRHFFGGKNDLRKNGGTEGRCQSFWFCLTLQLYFKWQKKKKKRICLVKEGQWDRDCLGVWQMASVNPKQHHSCLDSSIMGQLVLLYYFLKQEMAISTKDNYIFHRVKSLLWLSASWSSLRLTFLFPPSGTS